jgi:hypothetical protein
MNKAELFWDTFEEEVDTQKAKHSFEHNIIGLSWSSEWEVGTTFLLVQFSSTIICIVQYL